MKNQFLNLPCFTSARVSAMTINSLLKNLLVCGLLMLTPSLWAASGTWTQTTSGGLWGTTGNWLSGIVADASGSTADFSTLNLTADNTVHMNASHTLTKLLFDDTKATYYNWILDNNSTPANILTLAGTGPTITVGNDSATISAVIAGTTGWYKSGVGTLTLSGLNTCTGTINLINGTLNLDYTAGNNIMPTASILQLGNNASGSVAASYTLTLTGASGTANTQAFAGGANGIKPGIGHINLVPGASGGTIVLQPGFTGRAAGVGLNLEFNVPTGGTVNFAGPNSSGNILGLNATCANTFSTSGVGQANTWAVSGSPASQAVTTTAPNTVTVTSGSAPAVGQQVVFTVVPTNNPSGTTLTANQIYYVASSSSPTFTIATSRGGTALTVVNSTVNGTMYVEGAVSGLATYYGYSATASQNMDATVSGTITGAPNTIRFNNTSPVTVSLNSGAVVSLNSGGILVTPAVAGSLSKITGGLALSGLFRRELAIFQNNPSANFQIDTSIGDNGGAGSTSFVKNGSGTVLLTSGGTYNNYTLVNEGTLITSGDYVAPVTKTATAASGTKTLTGMSDTTGIFVGEEVTSTLLTSANTTWYVTNINPNVSVTLNVNANNNGTGSFVFNGSGGLGVGTAGISVAPLATLQIGNATTTGSLFPGQTIANSGTVAFNRTDTGLIFANVISGSGGLVNAGSGTVTINAAQTYTGTTAINAGTLALGASGSLAAGSSVNIAAGGTFDVSAQNTYTLGSSATLIASGTASAATIYGASGGTVNLGSRPIPLNYDGSNPALVVSQGTLSLSGQTITVNTASPLANGTYTVIHTPGAITGSPLTLAGTAGTGSIAVSGSDVVLTIGQASTITLSGNDTKTYGTTSTISATVTAGATGTVQFYVDGTTFGSPVTLSSGSATFPSTPAVPVGVHKVIASYSGDSTYAGSVASAVALTVNPQVLTVSGTRLYDGTTAAAAGILSIAGSPAGVSLTGNGVLAGKNIGSETLYSGPQPVRVNTTTGNGGSVAVTTYNVTVPAPANGNTLVAVIGHRTSISGGIVSSITQSGATWTRAAVAGPGSGGSGITTEIWYAPNVASAGTTVTLNFVSGGRTACVIEEYSGVLTANPVDLVATNLGATSAAADTGTNGFSAQENELWVGGIGVEGNTTTLGTPNNSFTIVANSTSLNNSGSDARIYALEKFPNTVGLANSGGTLSGSTGWSGAVACFKATQTLTRSGANAGNYTLLPASSSVSVTAQPITVTAAANAKYYDGTITAMATPTGSALQNGDVITSGESYDNVNVGTTHVLTPATVVIKNAAQTLDETANYSITSATIATGLINQRPITVTAHTNTKIYDGNTSATNVPTLTSGTLAGGDGFAMLTEHYSDATVGTGKTLIPSATITNSASADVTANYTITPINDASGLIQAATSLLLTNNIGGTNYYGQTLIFTALVQSNSVVTAVNATTNIIFIIGSTPVWTNALVGGAAYYTNSSLPAGITNLTAQYSGDNNYLGSSLTVTQTVLQATPTPTLASTANPDGYRDRLSFTNTLNLDATGYVLFETNSVLLSSNNVSGGVAVSLTTTNLPRGITPVAVIYSGDKNYLSVTNTLSQTVTNHPPMAAVMTVVGNNGGDLPITLSDVATNWTDADGDPISLTGVNLTTTNGVIVSASNWVYQTNGSMVSIVTTNSWSYIFYSGGSSRADQISYSITDGQGGTNIGYINIVLDTNSVVGTNSIANITVGASNSITAYGIPGYTYILERSTNLSPSVWVDVATNVAATNGVINAVDTFWDLGGVAPSPSAFYQLKWPSP